MRLINLNFSKNGKKWFLDLVWPHYAECHRWGDEWGYCVSLILLTLVTMATMVNEGASVWQLVGWIENLPFEDLSVILLCTHNNKKKRFGAIKEWRGIKILKWIQYHMMITLLMSIKCTIGKIWWPPHVTSNWPYYLWTSQVMLYFYGGCM